MSSSATGQITVELIGPPCVKCGSERGWDGPTYCPVQYSPDPDEAPTPDSLDFTCRTCGYVREEPTKDAPKSTPPRLPPPACGPERDPGRRDEVGAFSAWASRALARLAKGGR